MSDQIELEEYEIIYQDDVDICIYHRYNFGKFCVYTTNNKVKQCTLQDVIDFVHQSFQLSSNAIISLIIVKDSKNSRLDTTVINIYQLIELSKQMNPKEKISFIIKDVCQLRIVPEPILCLGTKIETLFIPVNLGFKMNDFTHSIRRILHIGDGVPILILANKTILDDYKLSSQLHDGNTFDVIIPISLSPTVLLISREPFQGDARDAMIQFDAVFGGSSYPISMTISRGQLNDQRGVIEVYNALASAIGIPYYEGRDDISIHRVKNMDTVNKLDSIGIHMENNDDDVVTMTNGRWTESNSICGRRSISYFQSSNYLVDSKPLECIRYITSMVYVSSRIYKRIYLSPNQTVLSSMEKDTTETMPCVESRLVKHNDNWINFLSMNHMIPWNFYKMTECITPVAYNLSTESGIQSSNVNVDIHNLKISESMFEPLTEEDIEFLLQTFHLDLLPELYQNSPTFGNRKVLENNTYQIVFWDIDLDVEESDMVNHKSTLVSDSKNIQSETTYRILLLRKRTRSKPYVPVYLQSSINSNINKSNSNNHSNSHVSLAERMLNINGKISPFVESDFENGITITENEDYNDANNTQMLSNLNETGFSLFSALSLSTELTNNNNFNETTATGQPIEHETSMNFYEEYESDTKSENNNRFEKADEVNSEVNSDMSDSVVIETIPEGNVSQSPLEEDEEKEEPRLSEPTREIEVQEQSSIPITNPIDTVPTVTNNRHSNVNNATVAAAVATAASNTFQDDRVCCRVCRKRYNATSVFYTGCHHFHNVCSECIVSSVLPQLTGTNEFLPRHPACKVDHPICYECNQHEQTLFMRRSQNTYTASASLSASNGSSHNNHTDYCYACLGLGFVQPTNHGRNSNYNSNGDNICEECYNHHIHESIETMAEYSLPLLPCCPMANPILNQALTTTTASATITAEVGAIGLDRDVLTTCNYILTEFEVNAVIDLAVNINRITNTKANQLRNITHLLYCAREDRISSKEFNCVDINSNGDSYNLFQSIATTCPNCSNAIAISRALTFNDLSSYTDKADNSTRGGIASIPNLCDSIDCKRCDIKFCGACGIWPSHQHVKCEDLISVTRQFRDFLIDGRLKYLQDLACNGNTEQRLRAEECIELIQLQSTGEGIPVVDRNSSWRSTSNLVSFDHLNTIAVSPYVSVPPTILDGWTSSYIPLDKNVVVDESDENDRQSHPYTSLGPVEVIGIDELYCNLCDVERMKAKIYRYCPTCNRLMKKTSSLETIICGLTDPIIESNYGSSSRNQCNESNRAINGCGNVCNWKDCIPYIPNYGEVVTTQESELDGMKEQMIRNYRPEKPTVNWKSVAVGAVLADKVKHQKAEDIPDYFYQCDCPFHDPATGRDIIGPMLTCVNCPKEYRICLKCSIIFSHVDEAVVNGKMVKIPHVFNISYKS